jgi:2-amino-4-hydroxy-6-hydroxymethyldihydropteridine diphosphokinase
VEKQKVFVGLGANLEDAYGALKQAITILSVHPQIHSLKSSKFYRTSPVSEVPQPFFINAVCQFLTDLSPLDLLELLQSIQVDFGQAPKPKNAPRLLDLDILFFGKEVWQTKELEIPHPKWLQRLFVLKPLSDLIEELDVPGMGKIQLNEILHQFNDHEQLVVSL